MNEPERESSGTRRQGIGHRVEVFFLRPLAALPLLLVAVYWGMPLANPADLPAWRVATSVGLLLGALAGAVAFLLSNWTPVRAAWGLAAVAEFGRVAITDWTVGLENLPVLVWGLSAVAWAWFDWKTRSGPRPKWRSVAVAGPAIALAMTILVVQPPVQAALDRLRSPVGKEFGPFEARTLDGEEVRTWDREGIVVVSLWGTGCAPCREELPELAAIAREWQGRGVRFVTIEVWGAAPEEVREVAADPDLAGLEFLLAADGEDPRDATRESAVPQLLLVRDGIVLAHYVGYSPRWLAELREKLVELAGDSAGDGAVASQQSR